MKNYIYIKNDGIQVVTHKENEKITQQVSMEPGAILNGVIMNANRIKEAMEQVTPKLTQVTLVVDSSNIITKKIVIPTVSDYKLYEILKGEFDLYNKEDDYIFDTDVIAQTSNEMTVLCYAVARDFVESYTKLLEELNIEIERIEVAMNGIIKYVGSIAQLSSKTFLLNLVSGDNMLSLLFENGQYKFSNRSRLLNRDNPELLAQELYTRLSTMIQFNQSEKSEYTIDTSYYVGLTQGELKIFTEVVAGFNNGLDVGELPQADFDLEYLYPCSAILVNKKDVNFLVDKKHLSKSKNRLGRSRKVMVGAAIIGLLVLHMGFLVVQRISLTLENQKIETYLNSEEVVAAMSIYEQLEAQNMAVKAEKEIFTDLTADIMESTLLEEDTLNAIFDTQVTSMTYSLIGASINITGAESDNTVIVDYVEFLRQSGYFADVVYLGYRMDTGTGVYTFDVNVLLEEAESEEADD